MSVLSQLEKYGDMAGPVGQVVGVSASQLWGPGFEPSCRPPLAASAAIIPGPRLALWPGPRRCQTVEPRSKKSKGGSLRFKSPAPPPPPSQPAVRTTFRNTPSVFVAVARSITRGAILALRQLVMPLM
ncbi:uncharacterized protein LOC144195579 [Stigmatopora nigra]